MSTQLTYHLYIEHSKLSPQKVKSIKKDGIYFNSMMSLCRVNYKSMYIPYLEIIVSRCFARTFFTLILIEYRCQMLMDLHRKIRIAHV